MQPMPLQQCTIDALPANGLAAAPATMRNSATRRWYLVALASAVFAVGAVSAQPRVEKASLTVPASLAPSYPLSLPVSLTSEDAAIPAAAAVDATAVRAAIEAANARWLAAFKTGDATSLASIYAPDASLFPPSNVSLEGRDRIVAYFSAQRSAGMGSASLKTLDVVCVGDVAYEVGVYGFHDEDDATAGTGDSGRYFAIWKTQPDGNWRYQVGIWSSNRDIASRR